MAEKKTVKVRVQRDFLDRVFPGEEIMMSPARAEAYADDGLVEILEEEKPAKKRTSKKTDETSSD